MSPGGTRINLLGLGHVSWFGSVLCRSYTPSRNAGDSLDDLYDLLLICPRGEKIDAPKDVRCRATGLGRNRGGAE